MKTTSLQVPRGILFMILNLCIRTTFCWSLFVGPFLLVPFCWSLGWSLYTSYTVLGCRNWCNFASYMSYRDYTYAQIPTTTPTPDPRCECIKHLNLILDFKCCSNTLAQFEISFGHKLKPIVMFLNRLVVGP